jgi:hypothetical protein
MKNKSIGDPVKFKHKLYANMRKKSGAKTSEEYDAYLRKILNIPPDDEALRDESKPEYKTNIKLKERGIRLEA